MSLDEGAMRGSVPGDGPITAEVCKRLGGRDMGLGGVWHFDQGQGKPLVAWWENEGVRIRPMPMPEVNTAARLYHLLKALGFEVPA